MAGPTWKWVIGGGVPAFSGLVAVVLWAGSMKSDVSSIADTQRKMLDNQEKFIDRLARVETSTNSLQHDIERLEAYVRRPK